MNLQNLSALVEGEIINSPSITAFVDVCFEANKVRRGDLFIALDHEGIDEAILNGAYGIVFAKPRQISDQEIAWIKVSSMDKAVLRLLRFHIIEKSPMVFSCDLITLKLAAQITTANTLIVLNKSLHEHIHDLLDMQEGQYILYSEKLIDPALFVDAKPISEVQKSTINIVEQTLFETSFIYDDTYFERQLLSPFFMPYLEAALQFFKQNRINYQIKGFMPIHHFEPVFTNIHFQVKEFGKSDKVLIFEPEFDLIKDQIGFLKSQANWAKIIYVIPSCKADELSSLDNVFVYESDWEIMRFLKEQSYHFALIAEKNTELLESDVFAVSHKQQSLF